MKGKYISRKLNKAKNLIVQIPYNVRRYYTKKRIKSRDFTVISNNCWAGKLYQYLDMPYLSPTIGLYFFADDYLKFVKDIKRYLLYDLRFIPIENSKYKDVLIERSQTNVPIGVLDDIEIVFLHYKSQKEAYEKWMRRKQRINWDNIYFKFSRMNLCSEAHLSDFDQLPYKNRIILNNRKKKKYDCEYYYTGAIDNHGEMLIDTEPFPGRVCLLKLIN